MKRFVLALALVAPLCSCTSVQWDRFKAHAAAAITSTLFGAAAIVTGGIGGLALAGAGVVLGVTVDQALEPDRQTETIETIQVVQIPAPAADGKAQQPRVDTFVTKGGGTRGNLTLPKPDLPLPPIPELTWWQQVKHALEVAFWVVLGLVGIAAALSNDRLRGWLFGAISGGVRGGARATADLLARLRKARTARPPRRH